MYHQLFPSANRGTKDIGWLKSRFTFSFSEFQDPTLSAFGTLVAFNDDLVEAGKGFGIHPHTNMEIISVLLKGTMNHKDDMGYSTVIQPGGVQIMSAGSGLFHEEYNVGEEEVNFLQIWIQPKLQNIKPRYQTRNFQGRIGENQLTTLVSHHEGLGHCWINQNTQIFMGKLDDGKSIEHKFLPINTCLFLFCLTGSLEVDGIIVNQRDAIGIWNTDTIAIQASTDTEFVLIETPINQK